MELIERLIRETYADMQALAEACHQSGCNEYCSTNTGEHADRFLHDFETRFPFVKDAPDA